MSHQASLVPEKGAPMKVASTSTPSPKADQMLVRVRAVAINPVDQIVQTHGFLIKSYPAILGSDAAGEIEEVGSQVTRFKKGDRVLFAPNYLLAGEKEQAGFQEKVIALEVATAKIPDSMSFTDATVLPLSLTTAAAGLYTSTGVGLPLPSNEPKPSGKKLLLWGGASSVGSSVIQLAVASGLEVIVTASPRNFDYVKRLARAGKCKVFDYKSPSIVGDLVEELGDKCAGAFDAITSDDTHLACATVLAQLGGGKIAAVREVPKVPLPATVESEQVHAPMIFFNEHAHVGKAVFGEFLQKALASGLVVPAPSAEVIGKGLDKVQAGIDKHAAGVSAKKIVIEV